MTANRQIVGISGCGLDCTHSVHAYVTDRTSIKNEGERQGHATPYRIERLKVRLPYDARWQSAEHVALDGKTYDVESMQSWAHANRLILSCVLPSIDDCDASELSLFSYDETCGALRAGSPTTVRGMIVHQQSLRRDQYESSEFPAISHIYLANEVAATLNHLSVLQSGDTKHKVVSVNGLWRLGTLPHAVVETSRWTLV